METKWNVPYAFMTPVCWKLTNLKILSASASESRALYRPVVSGALKPLTTRLLKSTSDCADFTVAVETVNWSFSIRPAAVTCTPEVPSPFQVNATAPTEIAPSYRGPVLLYVACAVRFSPRAFHGVTR